MRNQENQQRDLLIAKKHKAHMPLEQEKDNGRDKTRKPMKQRLEEAKIEYIRDCRLARRQR
jgi:hypothetical protein